MAEFTDDFVVETSSTTGTGTYSLAGAVSGLRTFVAAFGTGTVVRYVARTASYSKWEVCYGTITDAATDTLTRNLIRSSTGSLIDWQAGDAPIYIHTVASADDVAKIRAHHRGSSAPTAPLQASMTWADNTAVTGVVEKYYDGADWIERPWLINETANAVTLNGFKGAAIASAATTDIWTPKDGNTVHITGTTGITSFGTAPRAGAHRILIFDSALTITAGTNVVTQGKKDIAVYPGMVVDVVADTTAIMIVTPRQRTDLVASGLIAGLTYANNGSDATNDLDIAAGTCTDATGVALIKLAALTKQSDVNWAVGTNAGGLDTGAVGNSDYYIWAILRSDTGVTDILYSLSSTSPTMPANYDYKRLIGWFKRSGGTIVAFKTYELSGGGLDFRWTTPTLDVDLANTLTTSRRTDAVKVPLNFSTEALLRVIAQDASSAFSAIICCPDETDAAPSASAAPLLDITTTTGNYIARTGPVRTSATGTVASRATLATVDVYKILTLGFQWSRR